MKNIKILNLLVLALVCCLNFNLSVFADSEYDSVNERIAAVGFGKIFAGDSQKDITNLFKKMDSYTQKTDFKKLKLLFSDTFVNNDGYDLDTYLKSVKNGFSSYKVKSMQTKINKISVNEDYAIVQATETGEAETLKPVANIEGNGLILSSSEVYYFLRKESNQWKITSINIIDESCSILYGSAKTVYFSLNVPNQVKSGTEYTASLSFAPVKDVYVTASLYSSPIIYPMALPQNEYKAIKGDGVLERLMNANQNGYNEYAVASIGLTSPKYISNSEYSFNLTGSAVVMRRVNVYKPLPQKIQKKSIDKTSQKMEDDKVVLP
jgi:hypothetical protein